ncbi:hypothetical protein ACFPYI_02715 [Halomarina salina]|uniref:Lipoprotein n=1 Tax=Halomarina salina TaxID=1872699 RepID=A0ABD5RJ72_9EURY|nr:hypothetical protein [Halomarina salina]
MRRLVPLSLVALLLLSGCMGGLGGTESTLTPEEADLPPGVNESGLQNASALAAEHNETAREVGIVLNATLTRQSVGPTESVRRVHTVMAAGGRPLNTTTATSKYDGNGTLMGQPTVIQRWGNESTVIGRSTLAQRAGVVTDPFPPQNRNAPTQARFYFASLGVANYTVDSVVERDGHTFTTLVANETTEKSGTVDARVLVDERGLIHEFTFHQDKGNDHEFHLEHRIIKTGPSPPERPDWAANVTEWPPENTTQNGSA